jgi:hypothetical protein
VERQKTLVPAALIREKRGDAWRRCTMMEATSLRNGIRGSIPISTAACF